jgi:pimeloyl-ACP methyl ester carboxylesterase
MRIVVLALALAVASAPSCAQDFSNYEINFEIGSGEYVAAGGMGREYKSITIYYHKPQNFTRHSPVLLVIPGAGRNGQDYRDAWIAASEEHGVLILSPSYSEEYYPRFWNYNLAGMIANIEFDRATNGIVSFDVSKNSEDWIFDDFDRIFNEVRQHLELETSTYDMFGHSAGGQVLHRMAMFHMENQANRILASNSGWYTLPTFSDEFPYGLKGSAAGEEWLTRALKADLVIFLGEMDDENKNEG